MKYLSVNDVDWNSSYCIRENCWCKSMLKLLHKGSTLRSTNFEKVDPLKHLKTVHSFILKLNCYEGISSIL